MPVFDCIIMANFFLEKMKCAENEKKVAGEGKKDPEKQLVSA